MLRWSLLWPDCVLGLNPTMLLVPRLTASPHTSTKVHSLGLGRAASSSLPTAISSGPVLRRPGKHVTPPVPDLPSPRPCCRRRACWRSKWVMHRRRCGCCGGRWRLTRLLRRCCSGERCARRRRLSRKREADGHQRNKGEGGEGGPRLRQWIRVGPARVMGWNLMEAMGLSYVSGRLSTVRL
jgi:hypothetical protein